MNMVYEIRWSHGQPKAWYKLTLIYKVYIIILQWLMDVALDHSNDDTKGMVVYKTSLWICPHSKPYHDYTIILAND